MKCLAKTSRWGVKPCPNNAKCDGYFYAHHPSVVLAKLLLEWRGGRHIEGIEIGRKISGQRELLRKVEMAK